jgi:hypothetical protein
MPRSASPSLSPNSYRVEIRSCLSVFKLGIIIISNPTNRLSVFARGSRVEKERSARLAADQRLQIFRRRDVDVHSPTKRPSSPWRSNCSPRNSWMLPPGCTKEHSLMSSIKWVSCVEDKGEERNERLPLVGLQWLLRSLCTKSTRMDSKRQARLVFF